VVLLLLLVAVLQLYPYISRCLQLCFMLAALLLLLPVSCLLQPAHLRRAWECGGLHHVKGVFELLGSCECLAHRLLGVHIRACGCRVAGCGTAALQEIIQTVQVCTEAGLQARRLCGCCAAWLVPANCKRGHK
jgi:hypothetical protein